MLNISAQISSFSASSTAVAGPTKLADESPESAATLPVAVPVEGVKVSLSGAGIQKAADDKKSNSNADIESSGLPDQTQKTLKMIRELKQQIEEKQQEMQALIADQSMDPETRQARVGALQTAISTLTASLATANNALVKQGQSGKLSDTQMQQASALAMK
ncbi:hypothetical protein [Pseudomonas maioricensis]|uniref:hypothetical protein n=1 Tax=Pseudomonas maioricensis TaxID=1766623 RepID=UPI001FAD7FDE|nr:hypothetical protein [Pseudomonas sp. S25]